MALTPEQKLALKQQALNTARNTAANQADVMAEADKIYKWLVEDQEETTPAKPAKKPGG